MLLKLEKRGIDIHFFVLSNRSIGIRSGKKDRDQYISTSPKHVPLDIKLMRKIDVKNKILIEE